MVNKSDILVEINRMKEKLEDYNLFGEVNGRVRRTVINGLNKIKRMLKEWESI